jgi:hypothetical protein
MTRDDAAIKILILTPQFPYPPHQGTTLRNFNLITGLAQRHEVHLLTFGDLPERKDTTPSPALDGPAAEGFAFLAPT